MFKRHDQYDFSAQAYMRDDEKITDMGVVNLQPKKQITEFCSQTKTTTKLLTVRHLLTYKKIRKKSRKNTCPEYQVHSSSI